MSKSLTGSPPSPTRAPWRLALLTAAVLLAHWAVLRAAPLALAAHENRDAAATWAFATRTIAAPTPAPSPGPVAVNPARTGPTRSRAGTRPVPVTRTTPADDLEKNQAQAPVDTAQAATETIADAAATGSATVEPPPTLLAAATPPGRAKEPVADVTATAAAKPLPAKAVRSFVVPPSARLKYAITGEVKGFPYHVNGDLLWTQDGKTYDARMEISHFLLGSRVQTSTGQLGAQGLEPTRFGDKVKSEVAAHFEREKGKISFSANTPDAPLLAGAQDQLSIFMQLAAMLAGDPTGFPPGSTLAFQAVGPRSADSWVFTVGASEKLALPGGDVQAVHLWRDPSGDYDPKTEIWLAPEQGYLPVRIRLTQRNGDFVDQQWKATQKP